MASPHPEGGLATAQKSYGNYQVVVNTPFTRLPLNALAADDTNTLTSFAAVAFDKEVQDHKIISVGEETRAPAPLPGLVAEQQEVLNGYRWIDQNAGVVAIPIDRAMELTAVE